MCVCVFAVEKKKNCKYLLVEKEISMKEERKEEEKNSYIDKKPNPIVPKTKTKKILTNEQNNIFLFTNLLLLFFLSK